MVEKKRIHAALLAAAIATIAPACQAQNTTDWLADTYGTLATHVGNAARSMWVAPEGVIYTASLGEEYEGGVAIYQNGRSARSLRITGRCQGRRMPCNC